MLVTFRFQLPPLANSNVKRRAECVSLYLPVQSLSFDKPYVVPPHGDTKNWAPYGLRLNYDDSEEVCPPDIQYAGPPVSGICPGTHEQTPSYESNSTTALWSPVDRKGYGESTLKENTGVEP